VAVVTLPYKAEVNELPGDIDLGDVVAARPVIRVRESGGGRYRCLSQATNRPSPGSLRKNGPDGPH
jgi:hypothetical protein